MKKLMILFLLGFSVGARAEDRPAKPEPPLVARQRQWGAGLQLGELSGLNIKKWIATNSSIECVMGYSFRRYAAVALGRQWYVFTPESQRTHVASYAGVGLVFVGDTAEAEIDKSRFFKKNQARYGAAGRISLGVEYLPPNRSFALFGELSPSLGFIPRVFTFLSGSIGARIYFPN